jgi:hypothetical protein
MEGSGCRLTEETFRNFTGGTEEYHEESKTTPREHK